MSFDVIGLGCACLDFLGVVPTKPEMDDQVWMVDSIQQGGGKAATALVTLAKLGVSTAFLGKIGNDPVGQLIKNEFDEYGVYSSHMIMDPSVNSLMSMILVDQSSGKRTILSDRRSTSAFLPLDIPEGLIESTKFLHLDGTSRSAAITAANLARKSGVVVVLDADILVCDDDIEKLVSLTDILIASKSFATQFTGLKDPFGAAKLISSYGTAVTVITQGEAGSVGVYGEHVFLTPSFEVDVVDTTGAGDVYHGAFIYGLLNKWSFEKSAEFASAVAAISCTKLGGRKGIPGVLETKLFLQKRKARYFTGGEN